MKSTIKLSKESLIRILSVGTLSARDKELA